MGNKTTKGVVEQSLFTSKEVENIFEKDLGITRPSSRIIGLFFRRVDHKHGVRLLPKIPLELLSEIFQKGQFKELSLEYKLAKERKDKEIMKQIWQKVHETTKEMASELYR